MPDDKPKPTIWIRDDSSVIDVIESAKTEWFDAHPECDQPTSESTDSYINNALGLPSGGALRPLAVEFADWTPEEIADRVGYALNGWWIQCNLEMPEK